MQRIWPNSIEVKSCPTEVTAAMPPTVTGPRRYSSPRLAALSPFGIVRGKILHWFLTVNRGELRMEPVLMGLHSPPAASCSHPVDAAPGTGSQRVSVSAAGLPEMHNHGSINFCWSAALKMERIYLNKFSLDLKPSTASADLNRTEHDFD